MRLAPSPRKKYYVTETNTKEEATQEAGIMKDGSQTQLEADTPKVELLKRKPRYEWARGM